MASGPPSNGTGYGGGIGSGHGGGVGSGMAAVSVLDGRRIGGGASRLAAAYLPLGDLRVEPEFTEAAAQGQVSGTVTISVVVDADAAFAILRSSRRLMGSDEKALEAYAMEFKPGMKDGKPVPVYAQIEVTFRLPKLISEFLKRYRSFPSMEQAGSVKEPWKKSLRVSLPRL